MPLLTATPQMKARIESRNALEILSWLRTKSQDESRRDLLSETNEWKLARYAPRADQRAHAVLCLMDLAECDSSDRIWGLINKFIIDELPQSFWGLVLLAEYGKRAPFNSTGHWLPRAVQALRQKLREQPLAQAA